MPEPWYEPDADATITALEAGDRPGLLAAVNRVLDLLETNSGDAAVRSRRFTAEAGGLWVVPVTGDGEDWMVLWREDHPGPGDVGVLYVGPLASLL